MQIVAESVLNLVFDPCGAKFVFVTHVVDSQKAVVGEHHVEVSLLRYPGRHISKHRIQTNFNNTLKAGKEIAA